MFSFIARSKCATVEQWATRNASITTPDQIIAAAIVTSIAKNFKDWRIEGSFEPCFETADYYHRGSGPSLFNSKKGIRVTFSLRKFRRIRFPSYGQVASLKGVTVDGHEIDATSAEKIYLAWLKAETAHTKVQQVNDKALADMRKNEAAWDLVEKLLGMKRDKNGALVPVKTVKEGISENI